VAWAASSTLMDNYSVEVEKLRVFACVSLAIDRGAHVTLQRERAGVLYVVWDLVS
jgi:hypothetical protein